MSRRTIRLNPDSWEIGPHLRSLLLNLWQLYEVRKIDIIMQDEVNPTKSEILFHGIKQNGMMVSKGFSWEQVQALELNASFEQETESIPTAEGISAGSPTLAYLHTTRAKIEVDEYRALRFIEIEARRRRAALEGHTQPSPAPENELLESMQQAITSLPDPPEWLKEYNSRIFEEEEPEEKNRPKRRIKLREESE